MGMDATAKLFYGVYLGNESEVSFPWENDVWDGDYDEWHRKVEPAADHPVRLVKLCTSSNADWCLAVPATVTMQDWDEPRLLPEGKFASPPEEDVRALLDFCKRHDMPVVKGPGWMLGAFYG